MMRFSLEGDMIGKIRSKMISRRRAFYLLGALGFVAAPTVPKLSKADVQRAGASLGRRKVALALQGGGSHGAFTWGVLDRLLGDATIDVVGVTGTSAGAMNGAVLVDGLVRGGPEQASTELRRYWEALGAIAEPSCYVSLMKRARRLGVYDFTLLKLPRSWKNFRCPSKLNNYPPLLVAMIGTLFIFILTSNWSSLIPGVEPP
jgi:Patatin-like phospholipase